MSESSENAATTRYLVADWWGHIFDDRAGEVGTRFVYDRAEGKMLGVQFQKGHAWHDGDQDTVDDVQDSLVNGNPQAIESPGDWDLVETDDLPDWHVPSTSPAP